jgi:hypothetical protein
VLNDSFFNDFLTVKKKYLLAIQLESFCANWGLLSVEGHLIGWVGDWAGCMKHLAQSIGITDWFLLVDSPTDYDWPVGLAKVTCKDKLVTHLTDCGYREDMINSDFLKNTE